MEELAPTTLDLRYALQLIPISMRYVPKRSFRARICLAGAKNQSLDFPVSSELEACPTKVGGIKRELYPFIIDGHTVVGQVHRTHEKTSRKQYPFCVQLIMYMD